MATCNQFICWMFVSTIFIPMRQQRREKINHRLGRSALGVGGDYFLRWHHLRMHGHHLTMRFSIVVNPLFYHNIICKMNPTTYANGRLGSIIKS
jgi:hypothetical protein